MEEKVIRMINAFRIELEKVLFFLEVERPAHFSENSEPQEIVVPA